MQELQKRTYLFLILLILEVGNCISQDISFSPLDSLLRSSDYYIMVLKDGTVLKGKLLKKEKRRIEFQDEMIGNTSFATKEVSSMEKIQPQDHYLITLMNGTVLSGKITSRKENEIIVETANIGKITVDASKIKLIKNIVPVNMKDGRYWFNSPVTTQYFMTPSEIPLNRGEIYYQNTLVAFNSFRTNIASHFSCTGGMIPGLIGFVSPHYSFRVRDWFYLGAGGTFATTNGKKYGLFAFGQCTFGNRNSNLSIGGGYGMMTVQKYYYVQKIDKIEASLFTISGMKRFAPKFAFVAENWFAPNEGFQLLSGGIRLMGEKSSWDFGLGKFSVSRYNLPNVYSIGPIPFLSYLRNL